MAIQNRRGGYGDFDPTKLKPGEFAIIQSGDPDSNDGKAVYICTQAGVVRRLVSELEVVDLVYNAIFDIIPQIPQVDAIPTQGSTNAVSSGGVWNRFKEVYSGEITYVVGTNKLNAEAMESGQTFDENGEPTPNIYYSLTEYIPLADNTKSKIAFTGNNAAGTARVALQTYGFVFYTADKSIISYTGHTSSKTAYAIPSNAVYVRASIQNELIQQRNPMIEFVNAVGEISATYSEYEITPVIAEYGLNYVLDTVIPQTKEIFEASENISEIATFANGTIMSSGAYQASYVWRVATPDITTISKDIKLTIAGGYRVYLAYFENGNLVSRSWVGSGYVIPKDSEIRMTIALVDEDTSVTADLTTFCGAVTYQPIITSKEIKEHAVNPASSVIKTGMTWDWWISANSVDDFGNVYIGYVTSDGFTGVLRRQPDGTTQYKLLEKSYNNDDHNGMATIVLDDGRILVIGSYGHTQNNHIICWRSKEAYSIDNMECLSFDIPQDGNYTYKTCYAQVFKYDGKLFTFMRFGSVLKSDTTQKTYCYSCLISTDNGDTWTPYIAVNGTDGYQGIGQTTDYNGRYLKMIYAQNPTSGAWTFRGFYIDLETYKTYNLEGTEIGEMKPLNIGVASNDACAKASQMTYITTQTTSTLKGRLFFCAPTPLSETTFVYATAVNAESTDFIYKRYKDGQITEFGNSGIGFGNVHYISGACFGNSPDTLYYSKATTSKADGNHELHKVKISNNAVSSDEIITEASMCILRPLFLGNGELATVVGHYNDQNSDGTYNGSFTAWELKPMFTRA